MSKPTFSFCVDDTPLTLAEVQRRELIAARHGAVFCYASTRGKPMHWFAAYRNKAAFEVESAIRGELQP